MESVPRTELGEIEKRKQNKDISRGGTAPVVGAESSRPPYSLLIGMAPNRLIGMAPNRRCLASRFSPPPYLEAT